MDDLSRLANMAEIFSAIVVVGGIMFAIIQMRQTRQQRRELAAIELFRSFSRSAFTNAYQKVLHYPDGLNAEQMIEHDANCEEYAMIICTTMENVGHNCWSAAYATPELYQWMERQAQNNQ